MDRTEFLQEARSLKFWVFQNKTKCATFAGVVLAVEHLVLMLFK